MLSKPIIYFENASTTRVDENVLGIMNSYHNEYYGNANSTHKFGIEISNYVGEAKEKIANLIQSQVKEIVFTSGATESINTILKGIVNLNRSQRKQIITVVTEHKAVLDTCLFLNE